MLITRLELVDFKSYANATVNFSPGTNAIVGQNGSGKSSLLEAIGFALFDSREDNIGAYVRQGASDATIVVTFASAFDQREYAVERRFGKGAPRYRVYDIAIGNQLIADGNAAVVEWLHTHLNVGPNADLPNLFRNTVGVPQGTVTSAFLGRPAERKAIFDPLLQVADYDRAWSNLAAIRSELGSQRQACQVEIATLSARVERLPELYNQHQELSATLELLAQDCDRLQRERDRADAEVAAFDARKDELGRLQQRAEQLLSQCEAEERLLKAATASLREAELAVEHTTAARPGHEAFLAAQAQLDRLEQRRAARDRVREQRTMVNTQRAKLAAQSEQLDADLTASLQAERQLAELSPLVEQQTALEAEFAAAKEDVQRLAEAQRRLDTASHERDRANAEFERIDADVARAKPLQADLARTEQNLRTLGLQQQTLVEQRLRLEADRQRLGEQSDALSAIETARCPVCEAELTPGHRAELLERNAEQEGALTARHTALVAEQRALAKRVADADALRLQLDNELRSLASTAERDRALREVQHRDAALRDAEGAVTPLATAPQRLQRAQSALQALGDPRHTATQLRVIAERRAALQARRDEVAARNAELSEQHTALERQLAEHDSLEAELTSARAARDAYQPDHERFLTNQATAAHHTNREREVRVATDKLAATRLESDQARSQAEAAARAYQPATHQRATQHANETRAELATKTAQQHERRDRLTSIEAEVQQLEGALLELDTQRAELEEVEGLEALLQRIRELLRQAGPEVTRRRVERVSLTASQLYGDTIGDHRHRLNWSEDYALSLEVPGASRSFRQLSGGEQMAAALALRLALLRETSSIDVAFFDEPTAHLDPERRANLAEQIMRVKGFAQLFVISHDDSFEQWSQNQLRVIKDERGSRLELR